ncbi:MAG: cysteine hydrolase [archaeon]|nr:MAG: cysteine hydrolase [archaeon]
MKTALIIIDMINGMEKWISKNRMKKTITNLKLVVEKARKKKIPIIYVVHKPLGKGRIKIYDEIKPVKNDKIVFKNNYSSFYKTKLDEILKRKKIKNLVIAGVSTHWCVLTTVVDASYRNYKITLLDDCTAAPSKRWENFAKEWLDNTLTLGIKKSNQKIW